MFYLNGDPTKNKFPLGELNIKNMIPSISSQHSLLCNTQFYHPAYVENEATGPLSVGHGLRVADEFENNWLLRVLSCSTWDSQFTNTSHLSGVRAYIMILTSVPCSTFPSWVNGLRHTLVVSWWAPVLLQQEGVPEAICCNSHSL